MVFLVVFWGGFFYFCIEVGKLKIIFFRCFCSWGFECKLGIVCKEYFLILYLYESWIVSVFVDGYGYGYVGFYNLVIGFFVVEGW